MYKWHFQYFSISMCLDYLSQLRPKVLNVYMNREEMHANVPFEDRQ